MTGNAFNQGYRVSDIFYLLFELKIRIYMITVFLGLVTLLIKVTVCQIFFIYCSNLRLGST